MGQKRVRRPPQKKRKHRCFAAAVAAIVKQINKEREPERRKLGITGRAGKETLISFATSIGRHPRYFYRIQFGHDIPSYELIKRITKVLPWEDYRLFEVARDLIEAMARDRGQIVVQYNEEASPQMTAAMREVISGMASELLAKELL